MASLRVLLPHVLFPNAKWTVRTDGQFGRVGEEMAVKGKVPVWIHGILIARHRRIEVTCHFEIVVADSARITLRIPSEQFLKLVTKGLSSRSR